MHKANLDKKVNLVLPANHAKQALTITRDSRISQFDDYLLYLGNHIFLINELSPINSSH